MVYQYQPKDRPLMFSAPMVHGIQEGVKTVTRRLAVARKAQSILTLDDDGSPTWADSYVFDESNRSWLLEEAPAREGDTIWVRESFRAPVEFDKHKMIDVPAEGTLLHYAAEGPAPNFPITFGKLRPSIYLPRWGSRITMRCTAVGVERLHDITEEDALAEGVIAAQEEDGLHFRVAGFPQVDGETARDAFRQLWQAVGRDQPPKPGKPDARWEANPRVWRVAFEVLDRGE